MLWIWKGSMVWKSWAFCKEYSVRRDKLSQALNCSCTSELNTGAFTIKLIVNAQVFSSDVQLQFSAWLSCSLLTENSLGLLCPAGPRYFWTFASSDHVLSCKTFNTRESIQILKTGNISSKQLNLFTTYSVLWHSSQIRQSILGSDCTTKYVERA